MTQKKKEHPVCFGKLDHVFPMGKDGLRHTPESCLACYCKTQCLRAAIQGPEGIKVQEERVDRSYESGNMSFVERWARKKTLERRKRCGHKK